MVEAAAAFAKAVAQDPKNLEAMQMQGVSLFPRREASPGEFRCSNTHVVPYPNANVEPNYVLGLCYLDTGRYDDARTALASQYGFAPDSPPAYLLAARMLMRREYLPVAEASARKALGTQSQASASASSFSARSRSPMGNCPTPSLTFEQERDLDPLNGAVYERLGDAYIRAGDFDRAQRGPRIGPSSLNRTVNIPFILLGKVLLKQQNPSMAKMYLEHALQMDPKNYMAHYLLGQAYRALGRTDDAAREYHAAEQIQADTAPHFDATQ